jgi:hypothetical protein
MEYPAFASIDLSWATLRYAEAAHHPDGVRPLRIGSCDFDFDITSELLHDEDPEHLDVVIQALADVFTGSRADPLRVVVHPPSAQSFVTVVPADLAAPERTKRFQQEAALVAGAETEAALHVTASSIFADTHLDVEPVQVLAVPAAWHERFATVVDSLPHTDVEWMLSTEAAARVMARVGADTASPNVAQSIVLVVGAYPDYTELGLLRNGHWYYSHHVDAEEPMDAAYNAMALLDRLEIPRDAVMHIGLYGLGASAQAFAPFESVFGVEPEAIQPFGALGIDPEAVGESGFGAGAYVPCVGAVL